MIANFKDVDSGELYYINSHTMRIVDGKSIYYAHNIPLLGENGSPFEPIPKDQRDKEADHIIGGGASAKEGASAYNKRIAYLKSRATKHAKSPEGKHLRHQALQREFKSMGYEKK